MRRLKLFFLFISGQTLSSSSQEEEQTNRPYSKGIKAAGVVSQHIFRYLVWTMPANCAYSVLRTLSVDGPILAIS